MNASGPAYARVMCGRMSGARRRRRLFAAVTAVAVVGGIAGTAAATSRGSSSTLTVGVFEPFSGPDGLYGNVALAGCLSATKAIDAAGGVLGHQMGCTAANSTSDPADAVPAVNKMLSSVSNLVFVVGPGVPAPTTAPLISARHIPMISANGSPQYDQNQDPYFYRLVQPDSITGKVLAYWAIKHGFKTAVGVFTNDAGSQTVPGPLAAAYKHFGGKMLKELNVSPGRPSYRIEAQEAISAKPQVIFTEMDPQSASTFWSEALQVNGKLPPVLGTEESTLNPWLSAVLPVVKNKLNLVALKQSDPAPSLGLRLYQSGLRGIGSQVKNPTQFNVDTTSIADFDGVTVAALAMNAAKSTDPKTYQPYITKVTGPLVKGAVIVHSYSQGVRALRAGKTIRYFGADGQIIFNQYHNGAAPSTALKLNAVARTFKAVGVVPVTEIAKLAALKS